MIDVQEFNRALREVDITIVEKLVQDALQEGIPAGKILNEGLIGAMGIVGAEFKANEIWVPEVLLAARNMHQGVALLKPVLLEKEALSRGTLVIGTVCGDIHDIGKNIVSVLMEGSGFNVIDLGTNVSTDGFVEAVEKHKPDILGLSALLTTTMLEMETVIAAVRRVTVDQAPKIIVGGAPVTQDFAGEIGADGFGGDAISGVETACKLLER
ncbi:Glutamate mutase sigma subunit [subsurface metagenome]